MSLSGEDEDSPCRYDEEEKQSDEDLRLNLSGDQLDDDMMLSSERLQTNVSFELDEQDALHEHYQN